MTAPEIGRSTREERQSYIEDVWRCRGDCDSCGVCRVFHGTEPVIAYEDYIEGRCSYREVSERFR